MLRARVVDPSGDPMGGVGVVARGAGVRTSATTNAAGVARLTVRTRRAGTIGVRVAGSTQCAARLTVRVVRPAP